MRIIDSGPVTLGRSVQDVVTIALSDKTVHDVYGVTARIDPWKKCGMRRRIHLSISRPDGIEAFLKDAGRTVCATLTQRIIKLPESTEVRGSVRLHILGAEFIKIRPKTTVESTEGGGALLRTTVEMHAVFPPPFARIVEDIMANKASEELQRFVQSVRRQCDETIAPPNVV